MKKIYLVAVLLIGLAQFNLLSDVHAQTNINELTGKVAQQGGYQTAGVTDTSLSQTVGRIIKIALGMIGTIFLVLTVYAGFLWMTASGNEEQVKKATRILTTAVIGIVIVLASYSITYFVTIYASTSTSPVGTQVGGTGFQGSQGYQGEAYGNPGCCYPLEKRCDETLTRNECTTARDVPANSGKGIFYTNNCNSGCLNQL
jgi:heme/copper-type cytochrome/quinol oxidase subunit 2